MDVLIESLLLVAAAEMGDKTQLLALVLTLRFKKPWAIMAGILVATLLNHALAAWVGGWAAALVSPDTLSYILAATFAAFALWILIPDKEDEKERMAGYGAFMTTLVTFFLAEMGDKTQLATLALGAKHQHALMVTAGTTLGMLVADGLAVVLGEKLMKRISMKHVRYAASAIFFASAIVILVSIKNVQALDIKILQALRHDTPPFDPLGPVWFQGVVRDITALGGWTVLTLLVLFTAGYLALVGKRREMLVLLISAGGGNAVNHLLKAFFDRPRPDVVPHLTYAATMSFPSGHAMMSAVIYLTCGIFLASTNRSHALRVFTIGSAAFVAFLVGVSRLYLGVHYPSDVLAGWTMGAIWAIFCWNIWGRKKGATDE